MTQINVGESRKVADVGNYTSIKRVVIQHKDELVGKGREVEGLEHTFQVNACKINLRDSP